MINDAIKVCLNKHFVQKLINRRVFGVNNIYPVSDKMINWIFDDRLHLSNSSLYYMSIPINLYFIPFTPDGNGIKVVRNNDEYKFIHTGIDVNLYNSCKNVRDGKSIISRAILDVVYNTINTDNLITDPLSIYVPDENSRYDLYKSLPESKFNMDEPMYLYYYIDKSDDKNIRKFVIFIIGHMIHQTHSGTMFDYIDLYDYKNYEKMFDDDEYNILKIIYNSWNNDPTFKL